MRAQGELGGRHARRHHNAIVLWALARPGSGASHGGRGATNLELVDTELWKNAKSAGCARWEGSRRATGHPGYPIRRRGGIGIGMGTRPARRAGAPGAGEQNRAGEGTYLGERARLVFAANFRLVHADVL